MNDRTITTTAVGRTSGQPDEVTLRCSANAVEPDVASARRTVAELATRLREVLDGVGIPDERVRTERFRLRQRQPHPREEPVDEDLPYRATETIAATLHDLDLLGSTLSGLVARAALEIDEVGFGFRTETYRSLEREAIADAVGTAREKAHAAAAVEDLEVGDASSLRTDVGSTPRRTEAGSRLKSAAADESGSVESGPLEVEARVEAVYELVEP